MSHGRDTVDRPAGLLTLPGGATVRGRRVAEPASPADFALLLAPGPEPKWPVRRVRWPDFWIPADRADALDALREAWRRAYAGQRVEVACHGGVGRTGTALAALRRTGRAAARAGGRLGPVPLPPAGGGDAVATMVVARRPLTPGRSPSGAGLIGAASPTR